jgi:hypothetical protein
MTRQFGPSHRIRGQAPWCRQCHQGIATVGGRGPSENLPWDGVRKTFSGNSLRITPILRGLLDQRSSLGTASTHPMISLPSATPASARTWPRVPTTTSSGSSPSASSILASVPPACPTPPTRSPACSSKPMPSPPKLSRAVNTLANPTRQVARRFPRLSPCRQSRSARLRPPDRRAEGPRAETGAAGAIQVAVRIRQASERMGSITFPATSVRRYCRPLCR